jgi:hypothetical protein
VPKARFGQRGGRAKKNKRKTNRNKGIPFQIGAKSSFSFHIVAIGDTTFVSLFTLKNALQHHFLHLLN